MKQEERPKFTRKVTIRFKPNDFERLHRNYKSTTCRKLSEYARKVLLNKPVTVNHRNQSADELLAEMIQLKSELSAIGNNFNQAVKKLHMIEEIPHFKTWVMINEAHRIAFMKKTEEIKQRMNQLYEKWSQK